MAGGLPPSWLQAFCDFTDTLEDATQDDQGWRAPLAIWASWLRRLILPLRTGGADGRLTERQAHSGILRMMAPDWWYLRLKRARDLQREHLAIAVGQVQKAANAYVSRKTTGEWIDQKRRNTEFFKSLT